MFSKHFPSRRLAATAALGLAALAGAPSADAASTKAFNMVRTNGLPAACAPNVRARVAIKSVGFAEELHIRVTGLPPNAALALFALQVPNFPFGVGWYIGDMQADATGTVRKTFVSRFNNESFAVAVGTPAPAPQVHPGDATTNPTFAPIHTLHLGAWFDSTADAVRAGCPGFTTPFNGDHTAGLQVLNSGSFPIDNGPLRSID